MLPHLSGRSRALLKRYLEETDAFNLPVGHTTVAFTELQLYNLLRVLTEENIRMSYSTMERTVIDAVKGTPTTAPSRTANSFQSRVRILRIQTHGSGGHRGSSSSESDSDVPIEVEAEMSGDLDSSSFYGESDSAPEMALITESAKKISRPDPVPSISAAAHTAQPAKEGEITEYSSQDTTLLHFQEEATGAKGQGPSRAKRQKKTRRPSQRILCKICLDPVIYISPCGSSPQSPYGLVSYV